MRPSSPRPGSSLERELRPVPVVRRNRDDLAVDELADPVPDLFLLIREQTPHVYEVNRPPLPVHSLRCNRHAPFPHAPTPECPTQEA